MKISRNQLRRLIIESSQDVFGDIDYDKLAMDTMNTEGEGVSVEGAIASENSRKEIVQMIGRLNQIYESLQKVNSPTISKIQSGGNAFKGTTPFNALRKCIYDLDLDYDEIMLLTAYVLKTFGQANAL